MKKRKCYVTDITSKRFVKMNCLSQDHQLKMQTTKIISPIFYNRSLIGQ
jgi:hypothetical protein